MAKVFLDYSIVDVNIIDGTLDNMAKVFSSISGGRFFIIVISIFNKP